MTNKTQTILLFIILILAALTVGAALQHKAMETEDLNTSSFQVNPEEEASTRSYIFTTELGDEGQVIYQGQDVAVVQYGGQETVLTRTVSASGVRYVNNDETFVFFTKGNEAIIEQEGEIINVNEIVALDNAEDNKKLLTFEIEPYRVNCEGVGQTQCLVVNDELFYENIEDFDFQEGTAYTLLVERTTNENPPADASLYSYRRVEVLKSNKKGDPDVDNSGVASNNDTNVQDVVDTVGPLASSKWLWAELRYNNQDSATIDSDEFIINFDNNGRFSSQTDCNTLGGSYTTSDSGRLTFGPIMATKMACMEESRESEYSMLLSRVTQYSFDDTTLVLELDSGDQMVFIPTTANNNPTHTESAQQQESALFED